MSENWDFFFCEVDNEPASIFVDLGICDEAPLQNCPELVWLRLQMNAPSQEGLSSNDEYERLIEIEDSIVENLASLECEVHFVGRNTSAGARDFFFYAENATLLESNLSQSMVPYPDYSFEIGTRTEDEWDTYFGFLFPDDRSLQDIFNRRLLKQLEDAGDDSEQERNVDHWVVFGSEDDRKRFSDRASEHGYHVEEEENENDDEQEFQLHLVKSHAADYETVTHIVMELFGLAEEYNGYYDGWGCELVNTTRGNTTDH